MDEHINGLSNVSQSAYKQFHSTETALLKVQINDINLNIDNGKVTAMTYPPLSTQLITTFSLHVYRRGTGYLAQP